MSAKLFVPLLAAVALLALPALAAAAPANYSFEETAQAAWSVDHQCSDGSVVQAQLRVVATRDFASPDTEDADPTARVQYAALCPDGSFSWLGFIPVTIVSSENMKSVSVAGSGTVRDNRGVTHDVTIDVTWTGVGSVTTTTKPFNGGVNIRRQRAATATGTVTFDGATLVSGDADHSIRPFIRTDEDRSGN